MVVTEMYRNIYRGMFAGSNIPTFIGGAVVGLLSWANFPVMLSGPGPAPNHIDHLREAPLQALTEGGADGAAEGLWGRSGAVVMAVRRPG